jgi:hypothetical protein
MLERWNARLVFLSDISAGPVLDGNSSTKIYAATPFRIPLMGDDASQYVGTEAGIIRLTWTASHRNRELDNTPLKECVCAKGALHPTQLNWVSKSNMSNGVFCIHHCID